MNQQLNWCGVYNECHFLVFIRNLCVVCILVNFVTISIHRVT